MVNWTLAEVKIGYLAENREIPPPNDTVHLPWHQICINASNRFPLIPRSILWIFCRYWGTKNKMGKISRTSAWTSTAFFLVTFPFWGCTSPNMIMKSWVGHREEELYRQWGPPSTVIDNGHDGKIVLYLPDSTSKNPGERKYINAGKPVEYITPRNHEYKRTKRFYITPLGNIYAWKWG